MNESHTPPRPAIAVVGVSALFPGSIDATGFWSDILAGSDLITDVPPSHWLIDDYYDPDPSVPDKTYAKRGAFLPKVDFDAMHWGVPPALVPETDTSQLLALIVAQKVLEDASAGDPQRLDLARTSVILGVTSGQELLGSMVSRLQRPVWTKALREAGLPESEVVDVCERIAAHYTDWKESTFPGLLGNVVAGRIANRLNLGGTNCVSDAACASTMSALSMAVNELQLGDSDLVITGGVDTMNDIFMFMCFSKTPALSMSGDCRPFSDQADGTMLGEGLGMVALKRLVDAERAGDRIYAVIRGVGASSDGRSKSVYAPVSAGQAKSLARAYTQAGYGPDSVELVEAHGTGTKAGDAAEFGGLEMVFGATARQDRQWCQLGSVKSQIGHAKAAAGAAGLFKVVMALHHKVLPPTIKIDRPNPALQLESSPFHLTTRARPWVRAADHPRRASVSAFGFGGSNFHLALEEFVPPPGKRPEAPRLRAAGAELVVLSADSSAALAAKAKEVARDCAQPGMLKWLAATSRGSALFEHRLSIVADSDGDLAQKLNQAAQLIESKPNQALSTPNGIHVGWGRPEGRLAFVFPGQGSQYIDMGADLAMHFSAALAAWDTAAEIVRDGDLRLQEVVFPRTAFDDAVAAEQARRLSDTEWAQPAIGCSSLSLLNLIGELELKPSCVAGHSFGEVTALHAAGVLDASQMLRVARRRGELMAEAAVHPGAMCAVPRPLDEVRALLEKFGENVVVANHNGPAQVVLSGITSAIEAVEAKLAAEGIQARRLPVATAFHSEVVADASAGLSAFLTEQSFATASLPVYSNTLAGPYPEAPEKIRALLAEQLARPVQFVGMIEAMYADGVRTFVEVGPGAVLTGLIKGILEGHPHQAVSLDRKGVSSRTALLDALGALVAAGHSLRLEALWSDYAAASDPRTVAKPKLSIGLDGANYGKPYPPPGGAQQLPRPNGPRPEVARVAAGQSAGSVAPQAPSQSAAPNEGAALTAPSNGAGRAAASNGGGVAFDGKALIPVAPPVAVAAAPLNAAGSPMSHRAEPGWAHAYQEAQRHTAEAHSAYMAAMAQSHMAFLQTIEHGFGAISGLPLPVTPTLQPMASALAAPPPAPAPAPTHAAPPTHPPAPAASVAPVVVPPPAAVERTRPAAAAVPVRDLHGLMLQIVSDKTGYPTEMLSAEMQLEGDLGIDSIKRVEILSAMRERAPELPEVDTAVMAKLQTLGEIVEYMQGLLGSVPADAAPSVSVSPAQPAAAVRDLHGLMLQIVSDKTGYPTEMLSAEMQLEGDLGIDSIKRVEILSAMREQAPELPEVDTAVMAKLQTLGEIIEYMQGLLGSAPPGPAERAPQLAAPVRDLHGLMLQIVSDKTGYPTEMLSAEMQLEGDLGIDSIKRVEILSAMREQAPELPEVDTAVMAKLQTLGEIIEYMQGLLGGGPPEPNAPPPARPGASAVRATERATPGADPVTTPSLGRFALTTQERPAIGMAMRGLLGAQRVGVTSDGTDLGATLVKELCARGVRAELVDPASSPGLDALLFLGGMRPVTDIDEAVQVNREAFAAAQSFARQRSGKGVFVTVQDTGGAFATTHIESVRAWLSGLAGLTRSVAQEWSDVATKAIDLERGGNSSEVLAKSLADELLLGGPELDVGLPVDGRRLVLDSVRVPVAVGASPWRDGDVVVASGGARGGTAATLIELATQAKLRFVLLGRTALVAEPPCVTGILGDAELKRALLAEARAAGRMPSPTELGAQVSGIVAAREIRATLRAIEGTGSEACYVPVDVTDTDALQAALHDVRAHWGPIAAIVHGAGVIHDKLLVDKTTEHFDRVFDTKVAGLRALLHATQADPIKLLCFFSSVAGRCGNVGQSDYAMANEVLNKVAWAEARSRTGCLVKSLGWGPWEGGMVSPELKLHFERMGVPLIPLQVGARMLVDELSGSQPEQVELVLGGEPRPEALAPKAGAPGLSLEVVVDRRSHPFLADHSIHGTPVVPVVVAIEWFSRAARAFRPNLVLSGIQNLKVLRGIPLKNFEQDELRLVVNCALRSNGSGAILDLELVDDSGTPYYRATAQMVETRPAPSKGGANDLGLEAWGDRVVYDGQVLFHGPDFQMIRSIDGVSQSGIAAALSGVLEAGWPQSWCTDPRALDGGLQLALLWSHHVLGRASLPTGIGEVRTFTDRPSDGPLHCTLTGRDASGQRTVSDVVFRNGLGEVIAELEGVEVHLLPQA